MSASHCARESHGADASFSSCEPVGSMSAFQEMSILQRAKESYESKFALGAIGLLEEPVCPDSDSMEKARALRRAEVYPQHAATARKLRGALQSAKRKKVMGMVGRAASSIRFLRNSVFCGVNVADDLGIVLYGGSAYNWMRFSRGRNGSRVVKRQSGMGRRTACKRRSARAVRGRQQVACRPLDPANPELVWIRRGPYARVGAGCMRVCANCLSSAGCGEPRGGVDDPDVSWWRRGPACE